MTSALTMQKFHSQFGCESRSLMAVEKVAFWLSASLLRAVFSLLSLRLPLSVERISTYCLAFSSRS